MNANRRIATAVPVIDVGMCVKKLAKYEQKINNFKFIAKASKPMDHGLDYGIEFDNSECIEVESKFDATEVKEPELIRYNSFAKINVQKFMHIKNIFQTVKTGDTMHLKCGSRVNPNTYNTITFEVGVKGWGIERNSIIREGVKLLDGKTEYGLLKLHHEANAGTDKVLRLYLHSVYGIFVVDDPSLEVKDGDDVWNYWK